MSPKCRMAFTSSVLALAAGAAAAFPSPWYAAPGGQQLRSNCPSTCTCALNGDATGDCVVGAADQAAVIAGWGPCTAPNYNRCADFDRDCDVDVDDLLVVISNWGATCP